MYNYEILSDPRMVTTMGIIDVSSHAVDIEYESDAIMRMLLSDKYRQIEMCENHPYPDKFIAENEHGKRIKP